MTACVNRKHTKKVAAVVTASLVGALSLGVAPVAAMATEGIDMQFVEGGTNEGAAEFTNGTVNFDFKKVEDNSAISHSADVDGIETVTANNLPMIVSATSVQPAGSNQNIPVAPGNDFSIQVFRADEDGNPTGSPLAGNRVTDAGEYVITITPLTGSDYLGQTFTDRFNVSGLELPTTLKAYEGEDTTDVDFVFTGSALDVNVMGTDGTMLKEGIDYDIDWYVGSKQVDEVKDAGTYVGKLIGKGKYAGSDGSVTVPVNDFDLGGWPGVGDVYVKVGDFTGATPTTPDVVYYVDHTTNKVTVLDPSMVTLEPTASVSGPSTGVINFNVKPSAVAGDNVSGTATAEAHKVGRLATYTYAGKALQDSYDLDASKKETFDVDDIKAMFGDTVATTDIEVVKTGYNLIDSTGADASDKAINDLKAGQLGTYTITITTVPDTIDGTVYGGSKTFTVRVWKGFIDCDTNLYCYGLDPNGKVAISSYAKGYDGEELTAAMFWIRNGERTASLGNGAFQAAIYDADGNKVDSAVDAGEYTLVVTSDEYKLTGSEGSNVLPITIGKVDLTTARIGELLKWNDVAGQEYLPSNTYVTTPSTTAINKLGLVYASGNDGADYKATGWNGDDWAGEELLPGYAVNVQVEVNDEGTWKPVAKIEPSDAGQYRVTLSVSDDVISNFVLPEGENSVTLEFTVAKKNRFSDVQPSDWFYGAVNDAAAQGYVHGDAGLTTFRPNAAIKRGEVAVILYNMSGMSKWWQDNENNSGSYVEGQGWKTGFDDVDSTMYYAEAIAWAKKTGVINGDAGTKNFRPEDTVTNEEFAAMLANYAEKVNMDDTVAKADVASLEGVKGADGITEWAKKSVAWAVENEVMGNNGADILATQNTTRARVAAMCVNYQPEAK